MFRPLILNQPSRLPETNRVKRKLFKWQADGSLDLHFDWSSLECFLSCNRSALYKLVYARTSAPRAALAFGAAFHAALEIWYKLHDQADKADVVNQCHAAIHRTYTEEYPNINLVNDYRTPEYCYDCFLKYVTEYRDERVTPLVHDGKKMVEFSFALDLGNSTLHPAVFSQYGYGLLSDNSDNERGAVISDKLIPLRIKWTGICDMLAYVGSDELWLWDHKTTSILSSDFFSGFAIAMQPLGYVNAVKQAFPDLPIQGFCLNVAACRKPTKTGTGFETHRSFFRYEDWQFTEWNTNVLALIEEFLANLSAQSFPQKTTWCIGKYGKCAYFDVCSMPPDLRLDILSSHDYSDNTWKPVSA